jgi:hypothetical protein
MMDPLLCDNGGDVFEPCPVPVKPGAIFDPATISPETVPKKGNILIFERSAA